jgi:hypothetical protein
LVEIRNPKLEIRNKFKTENSNDRNSSDGTPRVVATGAVIPEAKENTREPAAAPTV